MKKLEALVNQCCKIESRIQNGILMFEVGRIVNLDPSVDHSAEDDRHKRSVDVPPVSRKFRASRVVRRKCRASESQECFVDLFMFNTGYWANQIQSLTYLLRIIVN